MKMRNIGLLMLIVSFCAITFGNIPAKKDNMVSADNEFSLKVLQKMSADGLEKNISVSPMSIRAAMTLAWAGAAGKTATEIQNALVIQTPDDFAAKYGKFLSENAVSGIYIANSVWAQAQLLPDYSKICTTDFKAGVFQADFAANPQKQRIRINNWISEETNKMIPELLAPPDIDELTHIVLANAIYFKKNWLHEFKPFATHKRDFNIDNDKTVQVDTMHMTEDLPFYANNEIMAVRLEYLNNGVLFSDKEWDRDDKPQVSMIVIMPKESTPQKLNDFINGLTADKFTQIVDNMKAEEADCEKVMLAFPKFKLDCRYELKKLFEQMGVKTAFGYDADFSKMIDETDLFVSKIIHQAVIDVNETGTEAAGAMAVVVTKECIMRSKVIEFNRPFVFFIRNDKTGAILFAGKVVDPTKK